MTELLRALIYVLVVGSSVYWVLQRVIDSSILSKAEFRLCYMSWLAITILAFTTANIWLFLGFSAVLFFYIQRRPEANVGLYYVLLISVPSYDVAIPGVSGSLFFLSYTRILSMTFLVPMAIRSRQLSKATHGPESKLVVLLFIWITLCEGLSTSPTYAVRVGAYLCLDAWLPFYVARQTVQSAHQLRKTMGYIILGSSVSGALAMFETWRQWLLFAPLGTEWQLANVEYLARGGGRLRAIVATNQPIVLGCALAFALAFTPAVRNQVSKGFAWMPTLLITGGLVATWSRGPWVGALIGVCCYVVSGPSRLKNLVTLIFGGALAVSLSGFWIGPEIAALLPFIGTADTDTVDYRRQLADVSWNVLGQHWLLGDINVLRNPLMEVLRQGQGIIDLVNSYFQIALLYGVVGLILFITPHAAAMLSIAKSDPDLGTEHEMVRRCLLSSYVCVMVVIGTVSSIGVIPIIYWLLLGFASGMKLLVRQSSARQILSPP